MVRSVARAGSLPGREEILQCAAEEPRALHVAEFAARLGLNTKQRPRLRDMLEQLVLEGALTALPGQRYRGVQGRGLGGWEGVLSVHPRGFAFVNSAGQKDVFVPPPGIGAALHGDTVRIVVVANTSRGLEGRVEGIVSRRNPRVTGVLHRRKKSAWLEPDDERIRGPIVITGRGPGGSDGMAAVVNITRFPESANENPEGELLEVFGAPGDARTEVAKILARDNISEERDPAAERAARARIAELTPFTAAGRRDLRDVPLLTIDPVDARDHDDAVYVERRAEGYRAYVAIADVSEYVLPGSALDVDASERCFTTYLPDRAVPMLPAVLASEQCSLLPGVDRYSLCAVVDLDKSGNVQRFRLVEALVKVAALITYEDAACALGFIEGEPKNPQALAYLKELRVLRDLAQKMRRSRLRRGALDLDLPEPKVELDPSTGHPTNVTRRAKNPGITGAYQLVEEMMLLANERVARWLIGRRSPAVYRVHAPPDPERLEQLALAAKRLGVPFDEDTLDSPLGVARWLKRISEHPSRIVLEGLLLRSLKMAQYDINNIGHFGLASEGYLHFTSPIRRYPDLLVHRLAKGLLRGGTAQNSPDAIAALSARATRASEVERVVMQAEREVVDVYRCLLMRDAVGQVYEGRVSGFSGSGLYAVLDDPFVDVLVRFESMGPDRYELSDDGLMVRGSRSGDRIALGDRITIVIEDVALVRRTISGRRIPPEQLLSVATEQAAATGEPVEAPPRGRRGRSERPQREPERRAASKKAVPSKPPAPRGRPAQRGRGSDRAQPSEPPSRRGSGRAQPTTEPPKAPRGGGRRGRRA